MNVTGVIAILSKTQAYILRLTNARIRHLVVSDWAARAVLRYWRLRRQTWQVVDRFSIRWRQLSITLAGHALVLGLGFVLVVPVVTVRPALTRTVSAQYAGYVLSTTPARPRNAPIREVLKASALEERPAPEVMVPAAPPVPAAPLHRPPGRAATAWPPSMQSSATAPASAGRCGWRTARAITIPWPSIARVAPAACSNSCRRPGTPTSRARTSGIRTRRRGARSSSTTPAARAPGPVSKASPDRAAATLGCGACRRRCPGLARRSRCGWPVPMLSSLPARR